MSERKTGRGGRKLGPDDPPLPPPPAVPADPGDELAGPPPGNELRETTKVTCYVQQRDMVTQVAALLGISQQEVMLRYWRVIEEDLSRLLELRRRQIRRPPPA